MPRVGRDREGVADKSAAKAPVSGKARGMGSWTRSRDTPRVSCKRGSGEAAPAPRRGNEEEEKEEEGHPRRCSSSDGCREQHPHLVATAA